MKRRLSLLLSLALGYCIIQEIFSQSAIAQVATDGTTNTIVNANGNNFIIQQGDRAGNNLFHSFSDFSIPNEGSAFFDNATDIVNIFSRVTGGNISNISGLLRTNGNANLFLLNPAGIIFGEGASLDLGGSFVGSTAESFLFEDGSIYSATNPTAPPLLTVNVPLGLQYGSNPNPIQIQGANLRVKSGQTLTLVGGDINSERGRIIAPGGRVELGGLSAPGIVTLNSNSSVNFPENVARADFTLNNAAEIDVRGTGGGSIIINGRNLNLEAGDSGQSFLRAGITSNSTSADAQAGNITINITNNLTIDNSVISSQVNLRGVGNGGDLTINTGSLTLTNGGEVSASTFGQGNAGGVAINTGSLSLTNGGQVAANTFGQGNAGLVEIIASDSITIDGEEFGGISSGATSKVNLEAEGDAGGVTINTSTLTLTNGGRVDASTLGQGNAGLVEIIASDSVTIDGENAKGFVSGAISGIGPKALGNAGGVTVNTGSLTLTNGGEVSASTFGQGNAGSVEITASDVSIDGEDSDGIPSGATSSVNQLAKGDAGGVTINTGSLTLTNGGEVSASTFGQGNAGDITIHARESISISGITKSNRSGLFTDALINSGNSGNINVFTNKLTIDDSGTIEAGNFDSLDIFDPGTGEPGNINIEANALSLANQARIDVDSQSETGNQANINLKIADKILLQDNSFISATALERANGGNIDINTNFIIALPNQNNDIIANAEQGQGGNIRIAAELLLGIEERAPNSISNDIDASSEFGLSGTVAINNPDVNPGSEIVELHEQTTDPSDRIITGCAAVGGNSFTITGRGGLPEDPTNLVRGQELLSDLRDFTKVENGAQLPTVKLMQSQQDIPRSIVQVQGWFIKPDGEVELVVALPQEHSLISYPDC